MYFVNHNMFKAIAALTVLTVGSLGNLPAAHAWDLCKTLSGMHICAQYRADNDVVAINSELGYVRFGIQCVNNPHNWTWEYKVFEASSGNRYTESFMKEFAVGYCEGRLGLTSSTGSTYSMA